MIAVGVHAVGLTAPGLPGWRESLPILRAETPYRRQEMPPLKPDMLKPNERRRTTQTIKLALVAADDALQQVARPAELLSVCASDYGDLDIVNQICLALTQTDRPVSPTQFHNSVHNAPAGYWSIASGYRQASTSLGGLQGMFAAALLEAAVQAVSEAKPVLLVSYDLPAPAPLDQLIPRDACFGAALLLNAASGSDPDRLATLHLEPLAGAAQTPLDEQPLEELRRSLPAARALPLLIAVARQARTRIVLPYLDGLGLGVETHPC
jgi:hypothetical protein